jgi:hypothetical protein
MTWPSLHPAFASTQLVKGDGRSAGTVRLIATRDGAQFTEALLSHDAAPRSLEYRILASPAPVQGYRSTLTVVPSRGGSTVIWSSDFKLAPGASEVEVKKMIAGIRAARAAASRVSSSRATAAPCRAGRRRSRSTMR